MALDRLHPYGFYEFFCGGGMARLGLGPRWRCLFANDFDGKKAAAYRRHFAPAPELHVGDVRAVSPAMLPGRAALAWASFPCQDLSLAGAGAGLAGERSGTFWAFWRLMRTLREEGRCPAVVALENVAGLVTANGGRDLTALLTAMAEAGYRPGAMVVDAAYFTPQSRPRLFIVAAAEGVAIPDAVIARVASPAWHPPSLQRVVEGLPAEVRAAWRWWRLPTPEGAPPHFGDIVERDPAGVTWHTEAETRRLLDMMTLSHRAKVLTAQRSGMRTAGTLYKRTRGGVQRAEVRFDGLSGCLRTPSGGSSRQIVIVVEGARIRTRLISPRETARLMGMPEDYELPERYNDAYHLTGDGVAVPVVSWIERHLLRPLAAAEIRAIAPVWTR